MKRKKLPVILKQEEKERLLAQPNKRYRTGLRNYCMMLLQLRAGLRLSEVIGKEKPILEGGLRLNQVDLNTGEIQIRNGKSRDRDLWVQEDVLKYLRKWRKIRPDSKTDLFFTTLKGKKIINRYYREMVVRYARKAGIENTIGTHTLRHTYATEIYHKTRDIRTLQTILGHASITSTEIYTHINNQDVKRVMLEED